MIMLMQFFPIVNWTATSKPSEHKAKIIGGTPANNNALDTEVFVSIKYLSNFGYLLIYLSLTLK